MSRLVFMPGFDGDAALRAPFIAELSKRHEVRAITYPNRALGTLDSYRAFAMGEIPVDWEPILVAESFSGLVATRWASVDMRVKELVLCAAFARNPMGPATLWGSTLPSLVKLGPALMNTAVQLSGDPARRRWSASFSQTLGDLRNEVIAERLRLIGSEDVTKALGQLNVPVALLQFDHDQVIPAASRAQLEAARPEAHVVRLPGPHFAIETRPRDCAAAVDGALTTLGLA